MKHKNTTIKHKHQHRSEKISVILSMLCAIHCVITPVIILFLPMFAIYFEQYHWLEIVIIAITFILGSNSILHGYRYHHKNKLPAYGFILGIAFLITSSILHFVFTIENSAQQFINISGALLSAAGQFYNLKLSNQ